MEPYILLSEVVGRESGVIADLRYARTKQSFKIGDRVLYDPFNPETMGNHWRERAGKYAVILDLKPNGRQTAFTSSLRVLFEDEIHPVKPSIWNCIIVKAATADWEL